MGECTDRIPGKGGAAHQERYLLALDECGKAWTTEIEKQRVQARITVGSG